MAHAVANALPAGIGGKTGNNPPGVSAVANVVNGNGGNGGTEGEKETPKEAPKETPVDVPKEPRKEVPIEIPKETPMEGARESANRVETTEENAAKKIEAAKEPEVINPIVPTKVTGDEEVPLIRVSDIKSEEPKPILIKEDVLQERLDGSS